MTNNVDNHEKIQEFGERIDTLGEAVFLATKALEAYAAFNAVQQQNDGLFPNRTPEQIADDGRKVQRKYLEVVAGGAAVGHETPTNPISLAEQAVQDAFDYQEAA